MVLDLEKDIGKIVDSPIKKKSPINKMNGNKNGIPKKDLSGITIKLDKSIKLKITKLISLPSPKERNRAENNEINPVRPASLK